MRFLGTSVGEILSNIWQRGFGEIESRLRYARSCGKNPVKELVNRGLIHADEMRAYLSEVGNLCCTNCGIDMYEEMYCRACYDCLGKYHTEKGKTKKREK